MRSSGRPASLRHYSDAQVVTQCGSHVPDWWPAGEAGRTKGASCVPCGGTGAGGRDAAGRSQDLMALSDAHDARMRDVQLLARRASRLQTHKCRFSILRSSFIPSSHTHTEAHESPPRPLLTLIVTASQPLHLSQPHGFPTGPSTSPSPTTSLLYSLRNQRRRQCGTAPRLSRCCFCVSALALPCIQPSHSSSPTP